MTPAEPQAPESVPDYLVDGIDRQDQATLHAIEEYARQRREYLVTLERQALNEEELTDEGEELVDVDVEDDKSGTVVIKKVPCGKDCNGCPHGPYKYVVSREGNSLNWDYRGRS